MTDLLEEIFKGQNTLDEHIANKYGHIYPNHIDRDETDEDAYWDVTRAWVKQMLFCIMSEIAEVLDELQFKHWKVYDEPINEEKLKEEALDIFFFSLSLLIKLGYKPEDIKAAYDVKLEENMKRQHGKSKEKDYSN